jgi:hypothetical protein
LAKEHELIEAIIIQEGTWIVLLDSVATIKVLIGQVFEKTIYIFVI